MQAVVDGLMTHYELTGKGRLVLLLHGWGDNLTGLQALQENLSQKYQVLSLDLPGFGTTQAPQQDWGLQNYAEFIEQLLGKLQLAQPYAVVGHSNGGALAIYALAQGQLQADKLVLLAASGIRNKGSAKRALLQVVAKTGNVATLWLPERYRRALRKSLYQSVGSDALVAENIRGTFAKVVRHDVQAEAAKLTLPTLLIYAENDKAVPLGYGRRYKELIKNSELKIIPAAGHFVHLDEPELVAAAIKDLLQ